MHFMRKIAVFQPLTSFEQYVFSIKIGGCVSKCSLKQPLENMDNDDEAVDKKRLPSHKIHDIGEDDSWQVVGPKILGIPVAKNA